MPALSASLSTGPGLLYICSPGLAVSCWGGNELPTLLILAKAPSWMEQLGER